LKNGFNHPINWQLVKPFMLPMGGGQDDERNHGLTAPGEEAPGSVANFVELVQTKYFDENSFSRCAIFVIQTGCNRGDGFWKRGLFIRSEFSNGHDNTTEKISSMASSGKDTGARMVHHHSPTPHLDGKYTIFAETMSGFGSGASD